MPILKSVAVVTAALVSNLLLASPVMPVAGTAPVTAAEWKAMLGRAKAGGVVNLGNRPVEFGRLVFQPTAPVTIRGGVFNAVVLDQWHNVTFDGSRFESTPDMVEYQSILVANDPVNLTLRNCRFTGFMGDNGQLHVRGPSIREGRNVAIEHSRIERMAGFTNFVRTVGARFSDNDIETIREGLEVKGGENIVIERNRFSDFQPFGGDHADGVQFFTTGLTNPGETAARNVVIRDNLILARGKAQGIFIQDEINLATSGRGYKDFTIEGNIVVGAGWHGITASQVDNVTIRNNRLFRVRDLDTMDSRIAMDRSSGLVSGNEANDYIYNESARQPKNVKRGPSDASRVDAVIAEWMAQFRKG